MVEAERRRLVVSRRVVLGGGDEPLCIAPACLELRGSTIAAVRSLDDAAPGPSPAARAAAEQMAIDDHGDRLITPAFINAHTHLALGFLRGAGVHAGRGNMVEELFFRIEAALEPADVRAFARMGAYESLLSGVGLVWDHYYAGEQVAEALGEVGLCGVVAPTLQDLSGPGCGAADAQLEATERIAHSARLRAAGLFAAAGPHATDTVSDALLGRALELARRCRLPLHLHVAQSIEEHLRAFERHGCSPLHWLERVGLLTDAPSALLVHAIYASRADLKRLCGRPTELVFCPYSQLVFGMPARVGMWTELGLPWSVGTDCAASNDSWSVQQELRLVAAQRTVGASWSRAYDAFLADGSVELASEAWAERTRLWEGHVALAEPASLLSRVWAQPGAAHPGFRAGVIAPGALANLLVWDDQHPAFWPDTDPLAALSMGDPTGAIWAMYVAGRKLSDGGQHARTLLAPDAFAEARAEAQARRTQLLARAG